MTIPLCQKCCDAILEEVADHSRFILIGCRASDKIGGYAEAMLYCPILSQEEKDSVKKAEKKHHGE